MYGLYRRKEAKEIMEDIRFVYIIRQGIEESVYGNLPVLYDKENLAAYFPTFTGKTKRRRGIMKIREWIDVYGSWARSGVHVVKKQIIRK